MAFSRENFIDGAFSTAEDNVLKKFYIPALKEAVRYDGAIGFFSSYGLIRTIQGIDGLIKNKGKMRLVIGKPLSEEEYNALIMNPDSVEPILDELNEEWTKLFNLQHSEVERHRLKIFSWLCNNNYLEIKYAIRKNGMYHKKIGVLEDKEGQIISFAGSINFTDNALKPDGSSEQFDVFPDWYEDEFKRHGESKVRWFEKVWAGIEQDTKTLKIPSDHYKTIQDFFNENDPPQSKIEKVTADLYDQLFVEQDENLINLNPEYPSEINGRQYNLQRHQKDALNEWKANDFNGIMALATGSGKTITAIHSCVSLANTGALAVIVSVPYIVLADQWCEVLNLFNIKPVRCYDSIKKWKQKLQSEIASFNGIESKRFLAVVVVNKTLTSSNFQQEISKIDKDKLFFIGDECHHHAIKSKIESLPNARYRMGLSATPWSQEGVKKELLRKYYSRIVSKYSIDKAIKKEVLVGYNYHIHQVFMNQDESNEYNELSKEINKLIAIKNADVSKKINQQRLDQILMARARVIGSLEDKFNKVNEILKSRKATGKNTLFYCGDGSTEQENDTLRDIHKLTTILDENGWKTSKFTADETHNTRVGILKNLKNNDINAIVAIRVLDEGFDIPQCEEAFLIASSRNSRQFIQRRGRVLRTSPDTGKTKAEIQDFIVLPNNNNKIGKALVNNELKRAYEFSRVAKNKNQLMIEMQSIADKFDIDFMELVINEDKARKALFEMT